VVRFKFSSLSSFCVLPDFETGLFCSHFLSLFFPPSSFLSLFKDGPESWRIAFGELWISLTRKAAGFAVRAIALLSLLFFSFDVVAFRVTCGKEAVSARR